MTTKDLVTRLTHRGLTDTDIGAAVGVTASAVARWRDGTRKPQAEKTINEKLRRMLAQAERTNKETQ